MSGARQTSISPSGWPGFAVFKKADIKLRFQVAVDRCSIRAQLLTGGTAHDSDDWGFQSGPYCSAANLSINAKMPGGSRLK